MTDRNLCEMYQLNNSGVYLFEDTSEKDQALIDDKKLDELTSISDKKLSLNYCVSGYCTPTSYGYIRYNEGHSVAMYDYGKLQSKSFVDTCKNANEILKNMDVCISKGVSKATVGVGALISKRLYQRTTANLIGLANSGTYIYDEKNY